MRLSTLIPSKIAAWCRRVVRAGGQIAATGIVAGGLAFSGSVDAIELLTNGSFEQNNGFNGNNSGFGWTTVFGTDTTLGFDVYDHTSQVFYGGPAPAGAGQWYFHTVGLGALGDSGVEVTQDVDLTATYSTTNIDTGQLKAKFEGYLSGWTASDDHSRLELTYFDGSDSPLGDVVVLDGDQFGEGSGFVSTVTGDAPTIPQWKLYQKVGTVPAGARSAEVRIFQDTVSGNGNNNYADLLSLDVIGVDQEFFLGIDVGPTGDITFSNNTGADVDIEYYEIRSEFGSLSFGSWNSLSDQDLNPGSAENDWLEAGESDDSQLIEFFANGTETISFNGSNASIGQAFDTAQNDRDLWFYYASPGGGLVEGVVNYDVVPPQLPGDFNNDGQVNTADYTVWRDNLGGSFDLNGNGDETGDSARVVDTADYTLWKTNCGSSGAASLAIASSQSIPEPGTLMLLVLAAGGLTMRRIQPTSK